METRANYIVTGAFTLAGIVGVFGFIFWFQNTAGGWERSSYRVVFAGSVSGLRTGSAVLFNGIRVGEVSRLGLDAHDPRKVVATISVERAMPVRADTKVALTYQGLTGLAEVAAVKRNYETFPRGRRIPACTIFVVGPPLVSPHSWLAECVGYADVLCALEERDQSILCLHPRLEVVEGDVGELTAERCAIDRAADTYILAPSSPM
jgi:hypothetical protein